MYVIGYLSLYEFMGKDFKLMCEITEIIYIYIYIYIYIAVSQHRAPKIIVTFSVIRVVEHLFLVAGH